MNIPQDTLQAVADAAFKATPDEYAESLVYKQDDPSWKSDAPARRAVIRHALDNPALAPFLSGGIGEYTDEEVRSAWSAAEKTNTLGIQWVRAFIAALPRRESLDLAQAIVRAEKAEADAAVNYGRLLAARERAEKAEAELAKWRSELSAVMPAAEATPPAQPEPAEEPAWIDPVCGCWRSPDVPKDSPCPICKPAAQVPLGPGDCPPGSSLRSAKNHCFSIVYISATGVTVSNPNGSRHIKWHDLQDEGWQINTSIPDTGRWDAMAWRPCSKPGKEVVK